MLYCFGDIVVVEHNLIGVIVKSWTSLDNSVKHDVYVRYFNTIKTYPEELIKRYMVRHKYLSGDEIVYQDNAVNNRDTSVSDSYKDDYMLSNEQITVLMQDVKTSIVAYDCPADQLDYIVECLNRNSIILTRDLLKASPENIVLQLGLTELQYSIVVAVILGIVRDYKIPHKYVLDDYMSSLHKHKKEILDNYNRSNDYYDYVSNVEPILLKSKYYNKSIFSRVSHCLTRSGYYTLDKILHMTQKDMLAIRNLGKTGRTFLVNTLLDYISENNITDEIISKENYLL